MSIPAFLGKIKAGKAWLPRIGHACLLAVAGWGIWACGYIQARLEAKLPAEYISQAFEVRMPDQGGEGEAGAFVASKSGSRYYPKTCSGASKIKPENKVWFQTREEAEKAGYSLSPTCKS